MSATAPSSKRGSMRLAARMAGLSLIELMIAMTISLVVLAAVGWIYQGTMRTYRTQDAISRMQEGARYAFEVIGKDLRMAGTAGCSYQTNTNVLTSYQTDWYKNLFEKPISSLEQDGAAGEVTEFSDALSVLRADVGHEYIVSSDDSGTATFTLTAAPQGVAAGQLMVATDCNHAAVFQASAVAGSTITHAASGLNSSQNLGTTYAAGSRLYRLSAVQYYVANNAAGVPSLFRLEPEGAAATLTPEELVEGVEDLQVTFGVDSSATPDGTADYYTADPAFPGIPYLTGAWIDSDAALGANAKERWARVVSVRISLLMRSVEDRVVPVKQHYNFNGTTDITAPDLRLRKVFTHVIKLRNR